MLYSHNAIEKKWQKIWDKKQSFLTRNNNQKKIYILDMFPYPSGKGLHVGHPRGYTATDVIARMKRMQGYDVLHPIGWDAFGLPAEQYAIKTGNDPVAFTQKNINHFRKQLQRLGFSYDYTKEINTSLPEYYKTTQFIFGLLYKQGLAEIKMANVNWCKKLNTVLANEELYLKNNQWLSTRGDHSVEKKAMKQWVLKITAYADRLLEDIDSLNWPHSVKELQSNWIGKSEGMQLSLKLKQFDLMLNVFLEHCELLKQPQFLAISIESPLTKKILQQNNFQIQKFVNKYKNTSDLQRNNISLEKHGINTNLFIKNPLTNNDIPIWIVDYLDSYQDNNYHLAIPSFFKVDFLFNRKYQICESNQNFEFYKKQIESIKKSKINDPKFDKLLKNNILQPKIKYQLKDWIFSRQRYWGEPIPIIHWNNGKDSLVEDIKLPVLLPNIKDLDKNINSSMPLSKATNWLKVNQDGKIGYRETNIMPQWAGSCWYYIGYILKQNNKMLDIKSAKGQAQIKKWLPVDLYIGGQEHAVLHLLYARFWHKVLYDNKLVSCKEPFTKLFNQGMILGNDNQKMSKSKGNVISIDSVVQSHGADAVRINELFIGPINSSLPWSKKGLDAARHWLDRIYHLSKSDKIINYNNNSLDKAINICIKNVEDKINQMHFNTAISDLMIFINLCYKSKHVYKNHFLQFIKLLSLFAPHLSCEIWHNLGKSSDLTWAKWPVFDSKLTIDDFVKIPIQINNRNKLILKVKRDLSKDDLKKIVLDNIIIQKNLKNQLIKKLIIVPNRVVNIIV